MWRILDYIHQGAHQSVSTCISFERAFKIELVLKIFPSLSIIQHKFIYLHLKHLLCSWNATTQHCWRTRQLSSKSTDNTKSMRINQPYLLTHLRNSNSLFYVTYILNIYKIIHWSLSLILSLLVDSKHLIFTASKVSRRYPQLLCKSTYHIRI